MSAPDERELDAIVEEVVAEAHIRRDLILPEEIDYIREHALKKPLRVIHIWSLGVGAVIAGEYFGWNLGLPAGGPVGVLIASLVVCVLYLTWVLALSELSVAMPFAGGPLAYGRRAVGKGFGFLMGWSMFLESLFAMIATGLAAGGYVAFLLHPVSPPDPTFLALKTTFAILTAVVFFVVQYRGVKEQATIMLWLTYAAIAGLVWFWVGTAKAVNFDFLFPQPLLPGGWSGVLGAIPFALWWLVIIESVALAAEEAHEPHITIPRGLVLAQVTLVALVVLTWFFACGAADYRQLGTGTVDYPLPLVFRAVWGTDWFLQAFNLVALAGIVVSYNGMLYVISRQFFSLGRAGYLPAALGRVHPVRRTPHVSLLVWTLVAIAFIAFGHFFAQATAVAVLLSTLPALVWYILAMVCLFVLRRREPELFRPYKVSVYPLLPAFVAILSGLAAYTYAKANVNVLVPTAALYAAALGWYLLRGRRSVLPVAPEEVAARVAAELTKSAGDGQRNLGQGQPSRLHPLLERVTAALLVIGLLSLGRMILAATGWLPPWLSSTGVLADIGVWSGLFALVSIVGLASTRRGSERGGEPSGKAG